MSPIIEGYPLIGAGIMTGTSKDAVDIAIVKFKNDFGNHFKILHSEMVPFPNEIKKMLRSVSNWKLETISQMNFEFGKLYARALEKALKNCHSPDLDFIGCHGQTVYHKSGVHTLQIGTPAFLAEKFSVPVVHDFRSKDIAVGGTGAPLMPKFDELVFRTCEENRVCLNVGGIANVTILSKDLSKPVQGFDTGPGMALIDRFEKILFPNDHIYQWIENVKVEKRIRTDIRTFLISHSFIEKRPPKSTGEEEFGDKMVEDLITKFPDYSKKPYVLMRTFITFTSWASAVNVCNFSGFDSEPFRVIVSGGGVHNQVLFEELRNKFLPNPVERIDKFEIPVDGKEAIAFSFLAHETLKERPGNIVTATGANQETILGSITL